MDDLRQEKAHRERLVREKEIVIAEKFTIEQNLSVSLHIDTATSYSGKFLKITLVDLLYL